MSKEVRERFSRIATNYDFMNHFLSLGLDRVWRDEAANETMLSRRSFSVLDSATGTGNLAFAVYENAREKGKLVKVEATDFVPQMLAIARAKAKRMGIDAIRFKTSDSLKTSYKNNSFDVITTGFSLRNFDDVNRFLSESHRILRRNGKLVILELALPDRTMQRLNFRIYSYFIRFTSLFAGRAYNWFVDSINNFDKHALRVRIRNAGFKNVRMRELASGVAFLLTAEK